tara:strand:- start:115 stop:1245 length:1131 start_codon:yes stop_codon:yes gene_type:complete
LSIKPPSEQSLLSEIKSLHETINVLREENSTQRGLLAEYQNKYAELANHIQPKPHAVPSQTSPAHFLILGNGRTGSSWLTTNFNQLPDVRAHRQIGWRLGDQPDHPQRYSINKSDSMTAIIDAACDSREPTPLHVAGSKFIFQPYTYTHSEIYSQLSECIEPDIKLIYLKRAYLECFLSWKVRGVAHSIDPAIDAKQRIPNVLENHIPQTELRHLVLNSRGVPLSDVSGTPYPVNQAVDDILVMFSNDILARRLVENRSGKIIDYSRIRDEFTALAAFIGSSATTKICRDIIANPLTQKLPDLSDYLHPSQPLAEIAGLLDNIFWQNESNSVSWLKDNTLRLNIPGLADAFNRWGVVAARDGDAVIWRPQKPVMLI